MRSRMTVAQYVRGDETLLPQELVYGFVREPAAPSYDHQSIVTHLAALLDRHVRDRGAGRVVVSPVDVVLDRERALIVQPDVVFVSTARLGIVKDRVWGAPDLAIEVLSMGTARRDRTTKRAWYRRYGVRECWLVDPVARRVAVHTFSTPSPVTRRYTETGTLRSRVLSDLRLPVAELFR